MRSHLVAIVAVVVVVFAAGSLYVGRETVRTTERNVLANAASLAGVATAALDGNVVIGREQAVAIAANPALSALFADPSLCNLAFTLELFPGSHLDVFAPDGRIVCSSATASPDASHRGAPWLAGLADGDLDPTASFVDSVTGERAVAIAAPVLDAGGDLLGGVAVVLPTTGVAERLTETYGGPRRYQFAIVDTSTRDLLSASSRLDSESDAMRGPGFLVRSQTVPGTGWAASAGLERSVALDTTRTVLLRGLALGGAMLLVLLLALGVVYRRIARPLRDLTDAVGNTGPHTNDVLAAVTGPREITGLASEFGAAIEARDTYETQLAHQALHDPLTGLPNRALLLERLVMSLERAVGPDSGLAVLFLDVDRFKLVNDSLGHAAGDALLQAMARRLTGVLRPGDTLARFGGDEFVVVAEGCPSPDQARELADRLLTEAGAPVEIAESIVRMSASIGIALSSPDSTGDGLIRDADNAMYHAKEGGGARVEVFDAELRDRATTRRTLEHEFRVALERNELHVVYQPKIDLVTGERVGVEALLRWEHPALGAIPPITFIPIAEETGLIVEVGRFVLEEACRQLAAWSAEGIDVTMAVNVSERQLADPSFPAQVTAVLDATGVAPEQLCLELTESLLMSDTIRATDTLRDFRALGVKISIDDFGTGYSSLAYLHRFSVDELKIDRIFVKDLIDHPDQETLVSAMVAMGKSLGLRIVAEGVETTEQATHLRALGCDLAQGYLFARPQGPDRVRPALRRSTAVNIER